MEFQLPLNWWMSLPDFWSINSRWMDRIHPLEDNLSVGNLRTPGVVNEKLVARSPPATGYSIPFHENQTSVFFLRQPCFFFHAKTRKKRVFPKIGVPQNGWFIMENPIKMDDLGVSLFSETPKLRTFSQLLWAQQRTWLCHWLPSTVQPGANLLDIEVRELPCRFWWKWWKCRFFLWRRLFFMEMLQPLFSTKYFLFCS